MKDLLKRLTAASIAAMMLLPSGMSAIAENEEDDELVTFIVQTAAGSPAAVLKAELENDMTMSAASVRMRTEAAEERSERKNREILDEAARLTGANASDSYIYTQLDSGFSITAKRSDRDKILAIRGVVNICEAEPMTADPDEGVIEGAVSAPTVLSDTYRGQGTLIAVIDDGFNLEHDYFKEAPSEVKYSEAEARARIEELGYGEYYSAKIPFYYHYGKASTDLGAMNSEGEHGTHVAGIAAGKNGRVNDNTTINGSAPEAQLALMAAGNGNGGFNQAGFLAAFNDAAKLGADVVNMSFGSNYSDTRGSGFSAHRTAAENARKAGIAVCISQGNMDRGFYKNTPLTRDPDYGAGGSWPNITDTFSVASADLKEYYMTLTDITAGGNTFKGVSCESFDEAEIIGLGFADCSIGLESDFEGKDLTGKIAVMKRGSITFAEKTQNAKNAGAIAAIVYDNVEEAYPKSTGYVLPTLFMTLEDGTSLLEALGVDPALTVTAMGTGWHGVTNRVNGGRPSSFTSWGMTEELQLVPNVMSYGGNVLSADAAGNSNYITMSGTSMASPHLAGISASLKSYINAVFTPEELSELNMADLIGELIASSAVPARDENDIPYSPRRQGAGLADALAAMNAKVILYNDKNRTAVNLGDKLSETLTLSFKARNLSPDDITFDTVSVDAATDDHVEKDGASYVDGVKSLTVKGYTTAPVTIEGYSETDVTIKVTLDKDELDQNKEFYPNGFYIDGFIRLSNSETYAGIPFSGFYGDWGSVPIWDKTIYDEGGSSLIYNDNSSNIHINGTYLVTSYNSKTVNLGSDPNAAGKYSPEYMIISPKNKDKIYDSLTPHFALYRSSCDVRFELKDQESASTASKGYYSKFRDYHVSLSNLSKLPDGAYTLKMTGYFDDGKKKTAQSMEFPWKVIIDNTPPEIVQSLSADGKTLSVSAKDAHFIRSISVKYTDLSGNAKTVSKEFDCTAAEAEHSFSLTDADPSTISVTALDYAYNSSESGNIAPNASYELVTDEFVSDTRTDNNASLWQVRVNSGTNTMESISVRVNGKSPRDDKKIERNFTNTAVVFGVVVSAFADKVTDMKAIVNGNEVETTRSDTGAQQP